MSAHLKEHLKEAAAVAALAGTLGLVYLFRQLNSVQRRLITLTERAKLHETGLEYLTQRFESLRESTPSLVAAELSPTRPRQAHPLTPQSRTSSSQGKP